ncbi:MAG: hypothetical protein NWF02_07335 [Candidatus Bathyarchaeota archaeon]|nr:hypothetical protein [Candidatus Bathyarchaeum sp.]
MLIKTEIDTHVLTLKQIELSTFNDALREITGENSKIFNRMLQRHMNHTEDLSVLRTVEDNTKTLLNSLDVLINSKQLISDYSDAESITSLLKAIEEYFTKFGLETALATQLRKAYLKAHECLKKLDKPTELSNDPNDANTIYLESYQKFLNENVSRVQQGLAVKDKKSDWNIDGSTPKGTIQCLALEDSLRHLKTGLDFSKSRGDLQNILGTKSRADITDEVIASVCKKIAQDKRKKLVNKIKSLEGIQEQNLSEDEQLAKQLIVRAKRNRQ